MTAMTFRIYNAVIALGCLLAAESAWAHHNFGFFFDMEKKFMLTGTLTKVNWRNPHIDFSLEAKSDKGQTESWFMESAPPNAFKSRKISKAIFEQAIGQTVTVEASPARDGSRYGMPWKITFPDGRVIVNRGE